MDTIHLLQLLAAALTATGFAAAYALPAVNLLASRVSDFILGMLVAITLGGAVISVFTTNDGGTHTFVGSILALIFGFVLATLVRSVIAFVRS